MLHSVTWHAASDGPINVCGGKFWTLADACAKYGNNVTTDSGIPSVLSEDTTGIAKAVALCAAAETCVVGVGSDLSWASEGHDASNISYTDAQQQLVTEAAAASKKPIIVVTLTAVPLDLSFMLANPKIGAILHAGQPSVTVYGLAEVLFKEGGRSPAGRTIQTIYPSSCELTHKCSLPDTISMRVHPVFVQSRFDFVCWLARCVLLLLVPCIAYNNRPRHDKHLW